MSEHVRPLANPTLHSPKTEEDQQLLAAVKTGNTHGVKHAIAAGASLMLYDDENRGLLHIAAAHGYTDILLLLLRQGMDPNMPDRRIGNPPLMQAAIYAKSATAAALLDAGADMNIMNLNEFSPWEVVKKRDSAKPLRPLFELYRYMPHLYPVQATIEKLFHPNHAGLSPLDNPAIWHQWEEVVEALASRGEFLSTKDLMRTNAHETTYWARAVECGVFDRVLASMNAQGAYLRKDDLLDADGKVGPLLRLMIRNSVVDQIFAPSNWKGQPIAAMKGVYEALPEYAKQEVTNWRGLVIAVERSQSQQNVAGRG